MTFQIKLKLISPFARRHVLAVTVAVVGALVLAPSAGAFGSGNAAWKAYYNAPSNESTWEAFCNAGGGREVAHGDGVMACGPTGGTSIEIPGGISTPGFQCVELSERFLYITHGWGTIGANGAQVAERYASAHRAPLITNGTAGVTPHVGDVMSFSKISNFSDTGHTGVVIASSVDSSGNGTITLLSENIGLPEGTGNSSVVKVAGWHVANLFGEFPYTEWVQSGSGGGTPPPPPPLPPSFLPPGAINRYYDAQTHDHWVTSGGTPAAEYGFEGTLGFGALDPGPNEQTLYSCNASGDHFVSVDPGCEGRATLGIIGVAYSHPPTTGLQSLAIYRCTVNGTGDHFVSTDPGCEGQHNEGPLGYLTASQDRFNRYVASNGDHIDTARGVGAGARFEGTLGFVAPNGGAGRRAIYSCTTGVGQFTSADPGCEGQTVIGLDGWVYTSPGRGWPQTAAIYRCIINGSGDHFDSIDPGCEGQHNEGPLGYIAQTHPALDRFYDPQTKDHRITAGIVPNGYQFEGRLGYMLQAGGSGRHALYSCMIGTDQFTSVNSNCEGQRVLGQDGWAYNTAPRGLQTTPIYRCTVNGSGEHFVSADSGCEGQHTEGLLGYIASTPGRA